MNDGLWDGMTSHGWIEYENKRTDVSLTRTEHPKAQPTGALIILNHVLRPGVAEYSYHNEGESAAIAGLTWMRTNGNYNVVLAHKESEHRQMLSIAKSETEMDSYLARAPQGTTYSALSALID